MKGYKKLKNLKSTCYINVIVQMISHIDPVYKPFLNLDSEMFEENCLTKEFVKLIHLIWDEREDLISPDGFVQKIFTTFPQFQPKTQQDAQELLTVLLDKMDEELSNFSENMRGFFQKIFKGEYLYQHQCQSCGALSEIREDFNQLNLCIPNELEVNRVSFRYMSEEERRILNNPGIVKSLFSKYSAPKNVNIYDCLLGFLSDQAIEKSCDRCIKTRDHKVSIKILTYPDYLITTIKRFQYNYWSSKISEQVYLSKNLRLSNITQDKTTENEYILTAVIEHYGFIFKGHYKIYIKENEHWWELNDNKKSLTTFEKVFNAQAYIALYTKKAKLGEINRRVPETEESKFSPLELEAEKKAKRAGLEKSGLYPNIS